MLLLGIDIGTSSIKVSVVDAATQQCIASAQYPEVETEVMALHPGWAEWYFVPAGFSLYTLPIKDSHQRNPDV